MSNVSLYPDAKSPSKGKKTSLLEVLEGIKNGRWEDQISKYRSIVSTFGKRSPQDKAAKPFLPGVTISGEFTHRRENGLVNHSGFIAVDIDDISSAKRLNEIREYLSSDSYTYAHFLSSGGKGICVIVKINPDHHHSAFDAIEEYYAEKYGIEIDFLADVSRFRFVSYDPDLYLYEHSELFSPPKENQYTLNGKAEKFVDYTPTEQMETAEKLTQQYNTWREGERHKYIFNLAKVCNKLGISQSDCENYVKATYAHFRENPSNAITWIYKNRKGDHGKLKQQKRVYEDVPAYQPPKQDEKEPETPPEEIVQILLRERRADYNNPVEEPPAIVSVSGGTISTAGNITVITGQSKSGKSGVMGAFLAGAIRTKGDNSVDTLGLEVMPNVNNYGILYTDTEQSRYNHDRNFRSAIYRSGRKSAPDYLYHMWYRGLSPAKNLEYTKLMADHIAQKHGGIYALVIDGIGDYVLSVNDDVESNRIVEQFGNIAEQYNCPIWTVLHFNPGSFKERGHMGSQLQRKCESILKVTKDPETEISTLSYKELRNAGNLPDISFSFDSIKGYHAFNSHVLKQDKVDAKKARLITIRDEALSFDKELSPKDLREKIMENESVGESRAFKIIREMRDILIIVKNTNGNYELDNTGI